jgi:hypothetical protein
MSLTHEVCTWVAEQPGRRATLAQLREVFDPRRLAGALQQARRKRRLSYEDGAYHHDGSPTGHQQKVCRNDLEGYDREVELRNAEQRFAKRIGARRFEDIPAHMIRPAPIWRRQPPLQASLLGSAAGMCADQRVEMHDFQQKKYKPLDRDAVIRMAAAGMSQGRIATALGVAQSSVQRVLQAARGGTP